MGVSRGTFAGGAVGVLLTCTTSASHAEPQWSAGVLAGVDAFGTKEAPAPRTGAMVGLRADVLLVRQRDAGLAIGPYVDVRGSVVTGVRAGLGGSLLLPIWPAVPLIVSGGTYFGRDDAKWSGGGSADLFLGFRSFNFHSRYGMANGIFAGVSAGAWRSSERSFVFGARIDAELLALPFLLLWGALR